jgi:hypothetical protein
MTWWRAVNENAIAEDLLIVDKLWKWGVYLRKGRRQRGRVYLPVIFFGR